MDVKLTKQEAKKLLKYIYGLENIVNSEGYYNKGYDDEVQRIFDVLLKQIKS
jgi:hypothetical protein